MSTMPTPNFDHALIAFVNPASGGNLGPKILQFLKNHIGDENVFDIKADAGPDRGLQMRASDASVEVRCIVAGGDGTFSWVASTLEKKSYSHVRLMVIPLGSGNDMARALGWGKKYPGISKVLKYMDWINTAKAHRLDVWKLSSQHDPASAQQLDTSHGARPLMCNYLSLGADAFVELRFNQMRWDHPEKFKSRMGNFRAHLMVGLKYMCSPSSQKFYIADHIDTLLIDDHPISIPQNLQALIFLNIPSYGAGAQPWGSVGPKQLSSDAIKDRPIGDMYVDDQQFEVIGLRNLNHFGLIKLFGAHGVRIAQGRRMHLKLKSPSTPFQVDGEPWDQRGGQVDMHVGNKISILEGPQWKETSRKSASFNNPLHSTLSSDAGTSSSKVFEPERVVETKD